MRKPRAYLLPFFLALALIILINLQPIKPVYASPDPATYNARPTAYATGLIVYPTSKWTLKDPANAYDSNEATFAELGCNTAGFFNVTTFTKLTDPWRIVRVDIKIKYEAPIVGGNDWFKILQCVDPSATEYTLQALTDADTGVSLGTYSWNVRPEPNDGTWSWNDVGNIRVIFQVGKVGGADDFIVNIYEVWAVVHYRAPMLYVDPTSQSVSGFFTVDINITNAEDIYGWEFNITYDTSKITATAVTEGPFLKSVYPGNTAFGSNINDANGWVYAYCSITGDRAGVTGGGDLATISFSSDATGSSSLDFSNQSKLSEYNFVSKTTYNFLSDRNLCTQPPYYFEEVDGSVTITAVPEFPLGAAMEIALAAVIIYIWWRRRPKTKPPIFIRKSS